MTQGYDVIRELGFETVKILDVHNFDPSTQFPKEVESVIVISEKIEVTELSEQLSKYINSFTPDEKSRPAEYSFHTFIDGEATNRYLRKKGKELAFIEIPREALTKTIGEFISDYIVKPTGQLSTTKHVLAIRITNSTMNPFADFSPQELNSVKTFLNLTRQMGFESALALDGGNKPLGQKYSHLPFNYVMQTEKPDLSRQAELSKKKNFRNSFEVGEFYSQQGKELVTVKVPLSTLRVEPEAFKKEAAKLLAPYIASGSSTVLNASIYHDIAGIHYPSKYDSANLRELFKLAQANKMETALLVSPNDTFLQNTSLKKTVDHTYILTEGNIDFTSALGVSRVVSKSFSQVLESMGEVRTYDRSAMARPYPYLQCEQLLLRMPD